MKDLSIKIGRAFRLTEEAIYRFFTKKKADQEPETTVCENAMIQQRNFLVKGRRHE